MDQECLQNNDFFLFKIMRCSIYLMLFEKKYTEGPVQVMKYKFYKGKHIKFHYKKFHHKIFYSKIRFDFLIINSNLRFKDHGQGEYLKSFPYPGNNSRIIPLTSITVNWIEKNGNLRVRDLANINLRNAYLLTC